jgi:hypothetical protein
MNRGFTDSLGQLVGLLVGDRCHEPSRGRQSREYSSRVVDSHYLAQPHTQTVPIQRWLLRYGGDKGVVSL